MYEIKIPERTEKTEKLIEIIAVCLKPLPYIIAVTFGITNNAEINNTPTSWIDVTTVSPAINIIK